MEILATRGVQGADRVRELRLRFARRRPCAGRLRGIARAERDPGDALATST